MNGGYDEGYLASPCLWGTEPGSLVRQYIADHPRLDGILALDLGCGEGKNAHALAAAGAHVIASDCSQAAIANGRRTWPDDAIEWRCEDASATLSADTHFDVVVMYGLLHCLPDVEAVSAVIKRTVELTRSGGTHLVVAFNDGPHDLSAHPGFHPLLLSHTFYLDQYADLEIEHATSSLLRETHPHNLIPHFHSLTRIVARKR